MNKIVLFSLVLASIGSTALIDPARACMSDVDQKQLFVVNMPGRSVIEALDGDVVQMDLSVPVTPEYANARFVASSDTRDAVVVGESSLAQETPDGRVPVGAFRKRFYFKLVTPGETTLRIQASAGRRSELKVEQKVEIREAPRYRCR